MSKEKYIEIIEFLDFFYGDNLIVTTELRKGKSKEIQKEDLMNFKSKLDVLKQLINEHFELEKAYDKACDSLANNERQLWLEWSCNPSNAGYSYPFEIKDKEWYKELYLKDVE